MDIVYFHAPTFIIISILSNTPCHLTCYYTDKKPLKHHTTRIVRGLEVPWGVYFCFVGWKAVEQSEVGDTLTHTFVIPDWSFCQTKWFTFRGTVSGELSPSVGPIFTHHHPGALMFEYYNTGDDAEGSIFGLEQRAHTFTPLVSHTIRYVRLKLYRTGLPRTSTLMIKGTVAGKPSGPILSSADTDGNTLPIGPPYEWRGLLLDAGYDLAAGVQYAMVLRSQAPDSSNRVNWRSDCSAPTYPRGENLYSHNGGGSWTKVPGCDYMFEEYGNPLE